MYVSPNSVEITGYTPEELLSGFVSWVHEDDRPKTKEVFDRTFSEGIGGRNFEYKAARKNGEVWFASSSWEPLNDEQGDFAGVVFQTTDITERKQAEETKNRLISNITHELRTPLTSIEGYAGFMLSGKAGKLPENHRQSVNVILEESERLRVLIDNFLDLTTIDVEGLKMETATVSIGRIIESLVSSMGPELKKKEIRISKHLPPDLGPVRGDESKLHQLFSNLLSNAIKFTPAGGSVEIRASVSDEHIIVEVVDTGTGVSPEDMPHIFDRFYQADSSSTRAHRGAGLGLAICKEIVEAHKGRIEVESEPRRGSVFRVILPLGEEDSDV